MLCTGEVRSSGKSRPAGFAAAAPSGRAGLMPVLLRSPASPAWFLRALGSAALVPCPCHSLLCGGDDCFPSLTLLPSVLRSEQRAGLGPGPEKDSLLIKVHHISPLTLSACSLLFPSNTPGPSHPTAGRVSESALLLHRTQSPPPPHPLLHFL